MIDYDHRGGNGSIIALIESVCEEVQLATANCTGVKYTYMPWSTEVLLTMYLKPGIILNIRVTPEALSKSYVMIAFKYELLKKYW